MSRHEDGDSQLCGCLPKQASLPRKARCRACCKRCVIPGLRTAKRL
ncbi:hypothetical protein PA05_1619 [Cutibacterium acnes P05]|nr:hypothetical protein [Cutibacterium acnes P05]